MKDRYYGKGVRKNNACAFTLIEMLVVVAIIGILAALLAPSLHRALNMATSVSCTNMLKQQNIIVNQYISDFNGFIPPIIIVKPDSTHRYWGETLFNCGYVDAAAIAYNPSDKTLLCPASKVTTNGKVYYTQGNHGFNQYLVYNETNPTLYKYHKADSVSSPGKKLFLFDSGTSYVNNGHISNPLQKVFYLPGATANLLQSWNMMGYDNQDDAYYGRIAGKINILWLDGHVGSAAADNLADSSLWHP